MGPRHFPPFSKFLKALNTRLIKRNLSYFFIEKYAVKNKYLDKTNNFCI